MDRIVYDRMAAHDSTHWWYRARRDILADYVTRYAGAARRTRASWRSAAAPGTTCRCWRSFGEVDAIEIDDAARDIASQRLGKPVGTAPLPELDGVERGATTWSRCST